MKKKKRTSSKKEPILFLLDNLLCIYCNLFLFESQFLKNLLRYKKQKKIGDDKKMLFKNFISNLTDEVKGYKARLEILNNSSMDFEDIATDEELEIYDGEDTSIFDFFDYYNTSNIRGYIGKVIEKIVEDDSRFNDVIVWYFDIEEHPELMEELLKKMLNTDENIFTDEVQKVIFKILLWNAERERENGKNYTDVYRFEEDIMPELYFLAVKDNAELLEDFRKDEANFVNYRMKNKMDWEKFL